MRKIWVFGNCLELGYNDVIDEWGKDYFVCMFNVVEWMFMFILDFFVFFCVFIWGKEFDDVNLGIVVDSIMGDLEIVIDEKFV